VSTKDLYLDLLKRALTNSIYEGSELELVVMNGPLRGPIGKYLEKRNVRLFKRTAKTIREQGKSCPEFAHTMVSHARLDNVQECVERVIAERIPGDLIETGVWRGGCAILMRGVLKAHGVGDRSVWVADSFAGLPKPTAAADKRDSQVSELWKEERLMVSIEEVKGNFDRYSLLDSQVKFLKGWFSDTLPNAPIEKLAVARLDGDMYQSTLDVLSNIYPKLSPGGFLIIDDYNVEACRQAVTEYRSEQRITEPIEKIDWTGVFWRKAT
jgi:O-methyltransferase